jgi:hypothetical protein
MFRSGLRAIRWIVLLPVLLVGSLLYWSTAIFMGGMSLMTVGTLSIVPGPSEAPEADGTPPGASSGASSGASAGFSSITVHLEESAEPEDVNDNAGSGYTSPTEDSPTANPPGPSATTY